MELGHGTRNKFVAAASISMGAAVIIRRPLAFAIASTLALLIADPDEMRKACQEWKTKNQGGKTDELAEIRESCKSLIERLEKDAKWEGGTKELVEKTMKEFIAETEKCETQRDGVGDALTSCADLYETLATVAMAVATAMVIWAFTMGFARMHPVSAVGAELASNSVLRNLWVAIKPTVIKLALFLTQLGILYTGATALSADQASKFLQMEAMPAFNSQGLGNDTATGAPTMKMIQDPKMQAEIDKMSEGAPSVPGTLPT